MDERRIANFPPFTQDEKTRLVALHAEMSDLTAPKCAGCPTAYSCCQSNHCEVTIAWATLFWGVTLEPTGHPTLPLLGEAGCIAPPHMRPICTVHTCNVCDRGEEPGDPDWTRRYFELREQIEEIEGDLQENADMVDPNRRLPA